MLYILIALIIAFAASFALLKFGGDGYHTHHFVMVLGGTLGMVASLLCALLYFYLGFTWFAAEHQASIVNREYGTNYTQQEMFYAKNVIDTVRELDRKRVEVNGDLLRQEK